MTFGAPLFFWAALALLPLTAVYFIRTRPRRQPVNTFFLWQRVFRQKASHSLFQRLRNLLSLLLVALAFLAAVMALTRPRWDDGKTPDLLIVIDRSASMQAMDGGKSRLSRAKDTARSWITALGGFQRAAVATVADRLEYRAHFTNHTRELRDALDAIEPSDIALAPHALDELTLLSAAANRDEPKTRILFVTDRHSPPMKLPAGVEVVSVEAKEKNIGITAADLRWTAPGKATLFVSLISDFPENRDVELELVSQETGKLAHLFTVNVPARGEVHESIPLESIDPGAWLLRKLGKDALALDDAAPLGLNAPQPIPVQVVAKNPFFFEQCVTAFSRADSLFTPAGETARLALSEGPPPGVDAAIVFSPSGDSVFWSDPGPELPPASPEIVAKDHPLLTRIDPSLLTFAGARNLTVPSGSIVILKYPDGTPLLYTSTVDGRKAVVFNFDPSRENFFLSPWFPVFVHEATVLLTGREYSFPSVAATGTSVEIPGIHPLTEAGFLTDWQWNGFSPDSPADISRVGHYRFVRDETTWHLGGALLSPGESGPALSDTSPPKLELATGWPLAAWLLLAGVIVLLAEEILYHRRKVG
ncbi:MAG: VWA domain-containing protein [Luteolibacter sp.]